MRKRSLSIAVAVTLCIILIFSAVACDGKVSEMQEYKQILTNIIKSSKADEQTESVNLSLLSASRGVDSTEELFDFLNGVSEKNSSGFKTFGMIVGLCFLQDLLTYCESLEEVYGLKKLYGHTVYLPEFRYSDIDVMQEGYLTVVSKGNRKTAYLYGSKADGAPETFFICDIEYIDGSNFSYTILFFNEADGGFENYSYFYMDSYDKFASIDENYVYFSESSNIDDCFKVVDESVIENCLSLLKPKFDAIDVDAIRSYDSKKYRITDEQYDAASEVVSNMLDKLLS